MRNRSIRMRNLPPGIQEGLLQQELEKHTRVKRLEVFAQLNEAILELESAAVSVSPSVRDAVLTRHAYRKQGDCCSFRSLLY